MAKVISTYRGYSATTIKNRAIIPNQEDMTINGNDISCVGLTTGKIRNGTVGDLNQLRGASVASNVNLWSAFGPVRRREVNGILVNDVITPHEAGEFAGYNHNAPTPGFYNSVHLQKRYVPSGGTAICTADIIIGEPKYIEGDIINHYDCIGLCLTAWEGATLVGFGYSENTLAITQDYESLSCYIPNCTLNKTYTFKIFLTNSVDQFNQNGDNIICQIPGLDNYTSDIEILLPSTYNLQAESFTVVNPGLYGFTDAYSASSVVGLEIRVRLISQIYGTVNDIVWFSGDYNANDHFGTCMPTLNGGIPIPDYGYITQILFNEPF